MNKLELALSILSGNELIDLDNSNRILLYEELKNIDLKGEK